MKSDASFDLDDLSSIPDYPPRGADPEARPEPPEPPSDRGPTRSEIMRRRRIAMLVGGAWLVVLLLLLGVRRDFELSLEVLAHALLPALLGAAALYAALAPGSVGLGPNARTTVALAVGGPVAFVVCALAFPAIDGGHPPKAAFFCGDWGLLLGAVPLAALVWAQQRTCAAAAPWRSALIGIAMGLVGTATLGMHCANGDGWHVALGHGWPVVVFGIIGFGFVGRFTRVR
ncbi:MAG: DUF1109 family protein [Polyangiaceae bacterium]|nr:DUF1109 family protein [Polyangiaceae bacterium]